ncbi:glycosyltransferase [Novosphingobium marinum]|uniref:Glycosyltransferase involved in cell wall biosynthesis n=1 Tax=Novosphingobium marinum TaxID=1514948 RepID=A0A7Z0BX62_9SPHN|nr:glycosyltransferase [Novosphingobium marinum]NYH97027.1 glycosyltransferase involved in cell wall biosynthesis [Novosphingobium marinum]
MTDAISFIVPTFNRAEFLHECLDSILSEAGPDDEVLVVDDGSTDHTAAVLAEFAPRVKSISLENGGKARALNIALSKTDKPLVWIVDDDDVLAPGGRTRLMQGFASHRSVDFTYGRYLRFRSTNGERQFEHTGYWRPCRPDELLPATLEDMFVHQPGMLVRRTLYEQVGPFDEDLDRSVDYEMLIRLARCATPFGTDEVVFYQRQHDGERGSASMRIKAEQRDKSWLSHDAEIVRKLRGDLDLAEYLPGRSIGSRRDRRLALIQRATVMMRKGLTALAFDDFRQAAAVTVARLNETETETAKRALGSKYGAETVDRDRMFLSGLVRLEQQSDVGRELADAIRSGLLWRIKHSIVSGQIARGLSYATAAGNLKIASLRNRLRSHPGRNCSGRKT